MQISIQIIVDRSGKILDYKLGWPGAVMLRFTPQCVHRTFGGGMIPLLSGEQSKKGDKSRKGYIEGNHRD